MRFLSKKFGKSLGAMAGLASHKSALHCSGLGLVVLGASQTTPRFVSSQQILDIICYSINIFDRILSDVLNELDCRPTGLIDARSTLLVVMMVLLNDLLQTLRFLTLLSLPDSSVTVRRVSNLHV